MPGRTARFETATLAGTRPGGAVAASWAVLNHLGDAGYRDIARRLSAMTDAYVAGIEALGLRMIARPDFSIINYTADDVDIFQVAEAMADEGLAAGPDAQPKGMHAMMSLLHEAPREEFLADMGKALKKVRSGQTHATKVEATY